MPFDLKVFSAPYGSDLGANLFLDYTTLELRAYRDKTTGKQTATKWFLVGNAGGLREREVKESELRDILIAFFHQHATGQPLTAIESLPTA